ncbi:MAG: AtpZ/AtpI family protein [Acidobacteriota bacterium]|nr:AtpZ/AtpI family protein [Acidobacteriota bacterium]
MAEHNRLLLRLAGLGPQMVGSLLIGGLIGWYLDDWLGTAPWLLIIFIILGLTAGFLEIFRALVSIERAEAEEEEERQHDKED